MKTKKVDLFIDLHPGWHESEQAHLWAQNQPLTTYPPTPPAAGYVRCKITVELPEVPYRYDFEGKFVAVEEVKP